MAETWTERAAGLMTQTHDALQTVWNATNKGQRNKLLKNEEIKALLDRYGVEYEQG